MILASTSRMASLREMPTDADKPDVEGQLRGWLPLTHWCWRSPQMNPRPQPSPVFLRSLEEAAAIAVVGGGFSPDAPRTHHMSSDR